MSYKYEVFISYKWGSSRKEWVDKILYPLLEEALDDVLPIKPQIFKDTDVIVSGATLDLSLRKGLALSKCMVCIVSLPYFAKSVWCPTEFSAMLLREKQTGIRLTGNHTGFIFPIIFVDEKEKRLEDKSSLYQYANLRDLITNFSPLELDSEKYNHVTESFKQSNNYNELKNKIWAWVRKSIKPSLDKISPWEASWDSDSFVSVAYKDFQSAYSINPPSPDLPSIV